MPDAIDEAAFSDQIRMHSRLFYRVAFQILRNSALAEEACQQALCRGWQRRGSLCEPAALRAWLVRTVVHESLQMLRRMKIEKKVLAHTAQAVSGGAVRERDDAPGKEDQRQTVLAAVAGLPEPVREIVVLRMLQDLSGNQVAEILDLSQADVSRKLHAGMDLLRKGLAEYATA